MPVKRKTRRQKSPSAAEEEVDISSPTEERIHLRLRLAESNFRHYVKKCNVPDVPTRYFYYDTLKICFYALRDAVFKYQTSPDDLWLLYECEDHFSHITKNLNEENVLPISSQPGTSNSPDFNPASPVLIR